MDDRLRYLEQADMRYATSTFLDAVSNADKTIEARTTTLGQSNVPSNHLGARTNSSIGNLPSFHGHFRSRGGYGSSSLEIRTRFNSDRPLLRTLLSQWGKYLQVSPTRSVETWASVVIGELRRKIERMLMDIWMTRDIN